jgi:hypothetical protein
MFLCNAAIQQYIDSKASEPARVPLADEAVKRAIDAWFDERNQGFVNRMRAAIDAAMKESK